MRQLLVILSLCAGVAFAQPTPPTQTTVSDTVFFSYGSPAKGANCVMSITGPDNGPTSISTTTVFPSTVTVVIRAGVALFAITPNYNSSTYSAAVTCQPPFQSQFTMYLSIPVSGSPVTFSQIIVPNPFVPVTTINVSQIIASGFSNGQVICWSSTANSFGPCVPTANTLFSGILPGTNTGALVVGTNGSFTFSGAGIINANEVNGVLLSGLATGLLLNTSGVLTAAVDCTNYVSPTCLASGALPISVTTIAGSSNVTVNGSIAAGTIGTPGSLHLSDASGLDGGFIQPSVGAGVLWTLPTVEVANSALETNPSTHQLSFIPVLNLGSVGPQTIYNPTGSFYTTTIWQESSSQAGATCGLSPVGCQAEILLQDNAGSPVMYAGASSGMALGNGTVWDWFYSSPNIALSSAVQLRWNSADTVLGSGAGSADVALGRESAGVLEVQNGGAGRGTLDIGALQIGGAAIAYGNIAGFPSVSELVLNGSSSGTCPITVSATGGNATICGNFTVAANGAVGLGAGSTGPISNYSGEGVGQIGTANATTYYLWPGGTSPTLASSTGHPGIPVPATCTARNLYVEASAGPTSAGGTVTLYHNATAAALTCTLPSGSSVNCSDTTHTVAFTAGALWSIGVLTTQATDTTTNVTASFQCQ